MLVKVSDVKNKTRACRSRATGNIAAVAQSVEETQGLTIPRRSLEQLGIPPTSLQRILHKIVGLKAYKVHLIQELKLADHQQHRFFADWIFEVLESSPEFQRKLMLTD